MNKLYIVGIGPNSLDLISKKALTIIENSDILIGGKRNLSSFSNLNKETFEIKNNLKEMLLFIEKNKEQKKIVVLASGDPLIFGIADYIIQNSKNIPIECINGISAIQYLAAKIGTKWEDIHFASIHGRNVNIAGLLKRHQKVAVFTGKNPEKLLKELCENGFENCNAVVGENLSYENEKITVGTIQELSKKQYSELSILLLENKECPFWNYSTGGIPESFFERGQVPITKEEVRAISVSKLRLKPDSIVYDIGAGTGSVTAESALFVPMGKVFAFEKNPEAIALIQQNCKKFCIHNVSIIEGDIAETLKISNCKCDRAFIGGSGGNMDNIITTLSQNNLNLRIVINTITIESTAEALESLKKNGFSSIECTYVNIAKSKEIHLKHMMLAQNPITIICAQKGEIS